MTAHETKALEAKEKQELSTATEQMRPGPTFTPAVDIFENEKEIIKSNRIAVTFFCMTANSSLVF